MADLSLQVYRRHLQHLLRHQFPDHYADVLKLILKGISLILALFLLLRKPTHSVYLALACRMQNIKKSINPSIQLLMMSNPCDFSGSALGSASVELWDDFLRTLGCSKNKQDAMKPDDSSSLSSIASNSEVPKYQVSVTHVSLA